MSQLWAVLRWIQNTLKRTCLLTRFTVVLAACCIAFDFLIRPSLILLMIGAALFFFCFALLDGLLHAKLEKKFGER